MKALVYKGNKDIRLEEDYPEPTIVHPHEVKIKVDFCGICGTDLHEYEEGPIFFSNETGKDKTNVISHKYFQQAMGHEFCGEIVELGSKTDPNLKVGQKVVIEATGTCMDREYLETDDREKCCSCAQGAYNACDNIAFYGLGFSDGGFAEYCVIGDHHVIPYPEDIIPVEIAALTEPLAVAWHGVAKTHVGPQDTVLILGAGPIGLSTIFALKGHNVKNIVVCEPAHDRRLLAANFNVTVFDPTPFNHDEAKLVGALLKMSTSGWGFSRIYDSSGNKETFDISLGALKTNGIATNLAIWAHKAMTVFPMDLTLHEKTLTGSMCYTRLDFEEVIEAYKSGKIDPNEVKQLVTKVCSIEDGVEGGILELINHKDKHIKILINPRCNKK